MRIASPNAVAPRLEHGGRAPATRPSASPDAGEEAVIVNLSAEAQSALRDAAERELADLAARLPAARERAALAEVRAEEARAEQRGELSEDDEERVQELRQADQEVRAHEAAHVAAAAGHAGTPRYKTVTGPDGKQYAIAGSVSIDMSPEATPEATAQKMRIVRAAATAVSDPSGADLRVAAAAAAEARQAASRPADDDPHTARGLRAYQRAADLVPTPSGTNR